MSDDDTRHDELTDAMVTRFVGVLQEFLSDESEAEKSGGFARLGKHVLAAAISAGLTLAATTAAADLAKEEDKTASLAEVIYGRFKDSLKIAFADRMHELEATWEPT